MTHSSKEMSDIQNTYHTRLGLYEQYGSNSGTPHYYVIDWSSGTATVTMRAPNKSPTAEFTSNLTDETGKKTVFITPTITPAH